jgi:hypothetical protein
LSRVDLAGADLPGADLSTTETFDDAADQPALDPTNSAVGDLVDKAGGPALVEAIRRQIPGVKPPDVVEGGSTEPPSD